MIYKNFIYFIVAVVLFSVAPITQNTLFSPLEDILSIMLILMIFSHLNRMRFVKLKKKFEERDGEDINIKRDIVKNIDKNSFLALIFFSLELFVFDLKPILYSLFGFSGIGTFVNISMIAVFILHLAIIWYWSFRFFGEEIGYGLNPYRYIIENIKFNLVVLIPWIGITLLSDILGLIKIEWVVRNSSSFLFQLVFLILFLLLFIFLSPSLIVRMWNCSEMEEGNLKRSILNYSRAQGIEFKKILYWNSFGGDLITAAVIGFFKRFRYLLITPGLKNILNDDEMIAVISHETGHVKKRHLFYYLLFFIGFIIIGSGMITLVELAVLNFQFGFNMFFNLSNNSGTGFFNFFIASVYIIFFIVYFRYIFAYFMRNFEREADLFCFESDVDPGLLISAFQKIRFLAGNEKRGSNWHHFTIGERVDFLTECMKDKRIIRKHGSKVKKSIISYLFILLIFTFFSLSPSTTLSIRKFETNIIIKALEKKIDSSPADPRLYATLASLYYEQSKWKLAESNYEKSLYLNENQPEILNNLAWLLITCKDESVRSPKKGLRLALQAIRLKEAAHIFDTLSEAYLANERYEDAYKAAYNALRTAVDNIDYYKKQLDKMRGELKRSKRTIKL